jgi:hypothetical protein
MRVNPEDAFLQKCQQTIGRGRRRDSTGNNTSYSIDGDQNVSVRGLMRAIQILEVQHHQGSTFNE